MISKPFDATWVTCASLEATNGDNVTFVKFGHVRSLSNEREPQFDCFATLVWAHVSLVGENIARQSAPQNQIIEKCLEIEKHYAALCLLKDFGDICTYLQPAACRSLALSVYVYLNRMDARIV